jgi:hypothetical protein
MRRTVLKLNCSIWLLTLLSIFGLFLPVAASAFSSAPNSFAYDERNQVSIVYDGLSLTAFNYDSAAVRVADEEEIQPVGACSLFADFGQFLAANRALMLPAEDATLAGSRTVGYTTPSGEVFLQPGLSRAEQLSTLRHESVHAFFSPPGNGAVATFRQNLGQWGHDNSAFLNATEEIIAETHASGSLSRGLGHAFNGAYTVRGGTVVTPWNFIGEGTAIGGLGVGGYYLGNNLFGGKQ